jgi:hypothetical protein
MEQFTFSLIDLLTLVAIIAGPLFGVWLARYLDDRKAKSKRRWEIFSALMRTRNLRLSHDHVSALNLVEIEFHDNSKVIGAWKEYIAELDPKQNTQKMTTEEVAKKRNNKLTKLLDEIAQTLDIKIDQLDILEGNYIPQGWFDQEDQNTFLKSQVIKLLQGQSALPVAVFPNLYDKTLFPEPPEDNSNDGE